MKFIRIIKSSLFYILILISCGERKKSSSTPPLNQEAPNQEEEIFTEDEEAQPSSETTNEETNQDPSTFSQETNLDLSGSYLVVSGGFSTCPTELDFTLKEQLRISLWLDTILERRAEQPWILSCFGFDASGVKWIDSDGNGGTSSTAEFKDRILSIARQLDILLIGHSYGGNLVLETTEAIQQANLNALGLITLDPISPAQCNANEVVRNILFNGSSPAGCLTAPANIDIDTMELPLGFKNYYQTNEDLLHSGPIPGADSNQEMQYQPTSPLEFYAHNFFRNDKNLISEALKGW